MLEHGRAARGPRGAVRARDRRRRRAVPPVRAVLVTHGRADAIVLPSMAEHVLEVCPTARASWYDGVGHLPFVEDPARFDRELRRARRPRHVAAREEASSPAQARAERPSSSSIWPTPAAMPASMPVASACSIASSLAHVVVMVICVARRPVR